MIGAGGAGMYAALEAARRGCSVLLAERSLIGRGGATVMAQMTVAAALEDQGRDHWRHHYADTLAAGRGLCQPALAQLLCEDGPRRIREMDGWGVGWAREDGRLKQALAPGHDRARCVYVDYLNTGPAVSKTLRAQLNRVPEIRRVGELRVTDLVVREGECVGICGIPDEQSLALIKELADIVTRPELCYRHQWRLGDLLMWDNSMTQHLAISDYQLPLRRLMHRVTVNGTVPI